METRRLLPTMKNPFAIREDAARPLPREVYGWRIYALALSAAWVSLVKSCDYCVVVTWQP